MVNQILCQWADIEGRPSITAYYETCNQTSSMRTEPLQGSRRGRGITNTHTNSAEYAETKNQPGIALHQPGNNTTCGKEKAAHGCTHLGTELILYAASGDH